MEGTSYSCNLEGVGASSSYNLEAVGASSSYNLEAVGASSSYTSNSCMYIHFGNILVLLLLFHLLPFHRLQFCLLLFRLFFPLFAVVFAIKVWCLPKFLCLFLRGTSSNSTKVKTTSIIATTMHISQDIKLSNV